MRRKLIGYKKRFLKRNKAKLLLIKLLINFILFMQSFNSLIKK